MLLAQAAQAPATPVRDWIAEHAIPLQTPEAGHGFADMAVGSQPGGGSVSSFLPILNPGSTAATVTATYYAAGAPVGTQSVTVAANSRGTRRDNLISWLQEQGAHSATVSHG